MSSIDPVRYPIVYCPVGAARTALIDRLLGMGFWASRPVEAIRYGGGYCGRGQQDYICLYLYGGKRIALSTDDEDGVRHLDNGGYWGCPMILVNSPAHFLRHIKRAGIKP